MNKRLKNIFEDNIIIDQIETWPKIICKIIDDNEDIIHSFFERDSEISALQEKNIEARIDVPKNIYKEKFRGIKRQIYSILEKYNFVIFHCTRLLHSEIVDIENGGLKLANVNLIEKKLKNAFSEGYIDQLMIDKIREENLSNEHNRENQVCFFGALYTLRNDEGGLNLLFCHWGGEIIYFPYLDVDVDMLEKLRKIGSPAVVIAHSQFSVLFDNKDQELYEGYDGDLIHGMIKYYCYTKKYIVPKYDSNFSDVDFFLERGFVVDRVISKKYHEKLFEELVQMSKWEDYNRNCIYEK